MAFPAITRDRHLHRSRTVSRADGSTQERPFENPGGPNGLNATNAQYAG